MPRTAGGLVVLVVLGLGVAGCGGGAPRRGSAHRPSLPGQALAETATTHEYPSPRAPARRARWSPSATQALERFAGVYINWNAQDVAARLSILARACIGQARSELAMAAAETRSDSTLRQGGIANRGVVETVAPVFGHPDEYVVVTRESTTATVTSEYQGLAPAWHLTLATVTEQRSRRGRRWVISGWQPEN